MSKKKPTKAFLAELQKMKASLDELLAIVTLSFTGVDLTDGEQTLTQVKKCFEDAGSTMEITINTPAGKNTQHFLVAETIIGDEALGAYKLRVYVFEHWPGQPFVYLTPILFNT